MSLADRFTELLMILLNTSLRTKPHSIKRVNKKKRTYALSSFHVKHLCLTTSHQNIVAYCSCLIYNLNEYRTFQTTIYFFS